MVPGGSGHGGALVCSGDVAAAAGDSIADAGAGILQERVGGHALSRHLRAWDFPILGWNNDHRTPLRPPVRHERTYVTVILPLAVAQDGVRAGGVVRLGPPEGLLDAVALVERLEPGNDIEVGVL